MKMNKKVWALALAAVVSAGAVTVNAANDNVDTKAGARSEQTCKDRKDCKKKECKGDKQMRHGRHDKDCGNPFFEGIELTADQQAAVKAFKDQQKATREAKKEAGRWECQAAFMAEMKNILTPEQYQQLEQNAAKMDTAKANRKDGKADHKNGHKGGMDKKAHRGDAARQAQRPDRN